VPTICVDKVSNQILACYPWRTFYPLVDNFSHQYYRVTITDITILFRLVDLKIKQVFAIILYLIFTFQKYHAPTFAHPRYSLGGYRPSQTTKHKHVIFYIYALYNKINIYT